MLRINELEYCKLEVEYTAEAELVRSRRDAILTELKNNKTFKIPGFRPGKASKEAIFQHRKGAIKQQLISELSQEGYTDFLFENKVKPLFNPMITSCDLVGDKFWCNMTVLKSPDFELAEYKGLSIAQPALERTLEEDVAETLEGIRQQNGEMNPYGDDDVVEANDILTVSIEGQKQNGDVWTTIPELTKDGMLVYVNKMPALQEHLLGMKVAEVKEFQFSRDQAEVLFEGLKDDLNGVKFLVNIFMGLKVKPGPLDDALAVKVGAASLDELVKNVTQAVVDRRNEHLKYLGQQEVIKQLVETNKDFKIPSWLLDEEVRHLATKEMNLSPEELESKADSQVRLSFVLSAIRDKEPNLSFSDQEILNGLRGKVESQGQQWNAFLHHADQNKSLPKIVAGLRDSITLDHVFSSAVAIQP